MVCIYFLLTIVAIVAFSAKEIVGWDGCTIGFISTVVMLVVLVIDRLITNLNKT